MAFPAGVLIVRVASHVLEVYRREQEAARAQPQQMGEKTATERQSKHVSAILHLAQVCTTKTITKTVTKGLSERKGIQPIFLTTLRGISRTGL